MSLPVGPFVVLMYGNERGEVAAGSDNRYLRDKTEHPVYTGTTVAECLRCCATNRKISGSIPDFVIGIFH